MKGESGRWLWACYLAAGLLLCGCAREATTPAFTASETSFYYHDAAGALVQRTDKHYRIVAFLGGADSVRIHLRGTPTADSNWFTVCISDSMLTSYVPNPTACIVEGR